MRPSPQSTPINFVDVLMMNSDLRPGSITKFLGLSLNLHWMDAEELIGLLLFTAAAGVLVFVVAAVVL